MCGITGILRYSGPLPVRTEIEAMTSCLAHRGPDGQGVLLRGPVALGHTRLAIIDPSEAGSQPMITTDGRLAVVFNGEIYNFRKLRQELAGAGYDFRTDSDTEVILQAYARWGRDCVDKLRGMFALCVCDFTAGRLFLARDHVGIKPLFYRHGDGFFAFASELSALRAVDAPQPEGSLQSVDYFLRYQYIPWPHTIFHDVSKLPPAHSLEVDFDGGVSQPRRWWRIRFDPAPASKARDVQELVRERLALAVRRSLVSDVPVGLFLSGGMDSTVVALEAVRQGLAPRAFSIGFQEAGLDELQYARQAARQLGLALECEILEHAGLDILPELLEHYGEPFGDASAIPTWHVSRMAGDQVKTVLSGDGGDEAFGGYDRYLTWVRGGRWSRPRRRELWRDLRAGRVKNLTSLVDVLGFGPEAWIRFIAYAFYPQRIRLWKPEWRHLADTQAQAFTAAWRHARSNPGMALPQSMDLETYLPDAILTKVDRASMMHGLEVRPALLDRDLLEACARLPESCKSGPQGNGKLLLQQVLLEKFDKDFVNRPKQGFGIPRGKWLSPGGRGWEMLGDLLLANRNSPLHDWFDSSEIERHIRMHERGLDNSQHTWLLLVLAVWCDNNMMVGFTD